MFIPDPGSWFLPIPDPGSRIPDPKTETKERGEKKLVVIPFYVATNFTKLFVNYFSFEVAKKKIWDPGSGIGCLLTPGSGIRIPNSYFWELVDNFLRKKFHDSLKFGPNFFLEQFKNKIINNCVKFVSAKKGLTNFFFTPLFGYCFWIRDPRSGIRDG